MSPFESTQTCRQNLNVAVCRVLGPAMTADEWLKRKAAGDAVPALHFKEFAFKLLKVSHAACSSHQLECCTAPMYFAVKRQTDSL